MDWAQFILFALSVFGLFLWNRTESINDMRHMEVQINAIREESKAADRRATDIINAIREDIKDFHGRLCAIEERNRGKV